MAIKLTDFKYFENLERTLNLITPEMLTELEGGDPPPELHLILGPMPDNLKALLYIYRSAVLKQNESVLQIFHNGAGKTLEEIESDMSALADTQSVVRFLHTLFFQVLRAQFAPETDNCLETGFTPDFEVYIVP